MEEEIIEVEIDGKIFRMWAFVYYAMVNCKGA